MNRRLTALFAAAEALLVLGVGLAIPLAITTVLWATHFGFAPEWTVFWRAAADVWLLGHGVDVTFTLDPVLAALVGLLVLSPAITPGLVDWAAENVGILPEWVTPTVVGINAAVLAATGLVTRVLAVPGVNAWLERYVPILGATK